MWPFRRRQPTAPPAPIVARSPWPMPAPLAVTEGVRVDDPGLFESAFTASLAASCEWLRPRYDERLDAIMLGGQYVLMADVLSWVHLLPLPRQQTITRHRGLLRTADEIRQWMSDVRLADGVASGEVHWCVRGHDGVEIRCGSQTALMGAPALCEAFHGVGLAASLADAQHMHGTDLSDVLLGERVLSRAPTSPSKDAPGPADGAFASALLSPRLLLVGS